MKSVGEVARSFLRVRAEWFKRCEQADPSHKAMPAEIAEAVMQALAWVLDVDLRLMNAPKIGDFTEPEVVTITRIEDYECWLVEIPKAVEGESIPTEFCAFFLSDRHMRELETAVHNTRVERARSLRRQFDAMTGGHGGDSAGA